MKIAVYKEHRFEFMDGNEDREIILLSNVWQQNFDIEEIEGMLFYTKHVTEDEIDAMWETNTTLSLEKNGPQYTIAITDTPSGDMVEFQDTNTIPDELKELADKDSKKMLYFNVIKETYPDATLWKVRKDLYNGSTYTAPITIMEAICNHVKQTKISARHTILECGNCGFHFPYINAMVAFGEVYSTNCPVCDTETVKKRC